MENISQDTHTDTHSTANSHNFAASQGDNANNKESKDSKDSIDRKEFIEQIEQARQKYRHAMVWRRVFMILFFIAVVAVAAAQPFFHYDWLWEVLPCAGFVVVIIDGIHASRQRKKQKLAFRKRLYHEPSSSPRVSGGSLYFNGEMAESLDSMPTFAIPVADAQIVARHQLAQTRAEYSSDAEVSVQDSLAASSDVDSTNDVNSDGNKELSYGKKDNSSEDLEEKEDISRSSTSDRHIPDTQVVLVRSNVREQFSEFATKVGIPQRSLDEEFDQYCFEIKERELKEISAKEAHVEEVVLEISDTGEVSEDREISDKENSALAIDEDKYSNDTREQENADRNILWDDSSFFEDIRTRYADDNRLIFFSFGDDSQESQSSSQSQQNAQNSGEAKKVQKTEKAQKTGKTSRRKDQIQEDSMLSRGLLKPPTPPQTPSYVFTQEKSGTPFSAGESSSAHVSEAAHTSSTKKLLQPPVPSIFSLGNEKPQPWNQPSKQSQDLHSRVIKSVKQVAKAIPLPTDEQEAIKRSATPSVVSIPAVNEKNSAGSSRKKTLNSRTLNSILSQRSQDTQEKSS